VGSLQLHHCPGNSYRRAGILTQPATFPTQRLSKHTHHQWFCSRKPSHFDFAWPGDVPLPIVGYRCYHQSNAGLWYLDHYTGNGLLWPDLCHAILAAGIINQNNNFAIVVSTLAIAALFQPLRHRVQAIIDRRFYRRKYNAAKIVEAFSATLRNEVDLNLLREHLITVEQDTMQPAHVSLWLRQPTSKTTPFLQSKVQIEEAQAMEQKRGHGL
jgi:hypothetical protein